MNKKTLFIIITIAMVLVIIGGGLIASNYVKTKLNDNLVDQYAVQEGLIARQVAQTLELEVSSLQHQLEFIAAIPVVRDGDTETCNAKLLEILKDSTTKIGNLGRVGPDGIFRCSINAKLIGVKAANLGSYITDIFNDPEHKAVMSRAIKPAGSTSYIVAVHVPVFGDNHEFLGTLGGAIYLDDLQQKYIANVQFGKNGVIAMYDDDGTVLYHYKQDLIGKNLASPEFQQFVSNGTPPQQTIADIKAGVSGSRRVSFDKEDKVAAFAPVNIFRDRKWRISVSLPIASVYSALLPVGAGSLINELIFVIALIIGCVGMLFLWIMIKKVFNPIAVVTRTAEKIGAGDLSASVPVQGNDEMGRLAKVFNAMTAKLRTANADLEQKVKERTSDLEKFKQAVDSATDGIVITDHDFKIAYMNPTYEKMGGVKFVDVHGTNAIENLVSKKIPKELGEQLTKTIASGKPFITDDMILAKTDLAVRLSIYPILKEGKSAFYVALTQDISRLKEIDKAKTEFVSLASHQLRTPLSTINWYSEMLLSGDAGTVNPNQKEFIDEIYKSNQRMVELVNALLNVSRIDLGTFAVEPEPTDIRTISDSLLSELVPQIQTRKVIVNKKYADDVPVVNLDPKLMRIVIQNLLTNAIKYTPENGAVNIDISKVKNSLQIIVSDTGYGIPDEQQSKIFTKLFRADNVREKETDGTGLGLYIVKSVVEQSGGKIKFTSKLNKGTTFTVTIPIKGMKKKEGVKGLS